MSGHSKWATTKRQKAITDAKRSAAFTRTANLITIAARHGADPNSNFSLRIAVDKAREVNMPKENIQRAINRGAGIGGGAPIEELIYEGIGPAKAQFVIKCLTDSRNRTAAEVRHLFLKYGGSLGGVMWNFKIKGVIVVESQKLKVESQGIEELELELIDQGVDDVKVSDEEIIIYTKPEDLLKIKKFLEDKKIKIESAEVEYVAKEKIELSENEKESLEKFIDELEENEDISDYYDNVAS